MVRRKSSPTSTKDKLKFITSTPKAVRPSLAKVAKRTSSPNESKISPSKKNSSASSARKLHRYKPGALALKEIRQYQASTKTLVPRLPFSRVVRETIQKVCRAASSMEFRMQRKALEALQEAAEMYLVQLMDDSYLCSLHAHRSTLMVRDIQLVRRLRGPLGT